MNSSSLSSLERKRGGRGSRARKKEKVDGRNSLNALISYQRADVKFQTTELSTYFKICTQRAKTKNLSLGESRG